VSAGTRNERAGTPRGASRPVSLAAAWPAAVRLAGRRRPAQGRPEYTDQALAAAEDIAEDVERELVLADLETIPGQPRYW
jgi:hypothetical protein